MKKLLAAALAAIMVLGLAGCGAGGGEPTRNVITPDTTEAGTTAASEAETSSEEATEPSSEAPTEPDAPAVDGDPVLLHFVTGSAPIEGANSVYYDEIFLRDDDAARYPLLAAALEGLNSETKTAAQNAQASMNGLTGYNSKELTVSVVRADSNIVSLRLEQIYYTEGATDVESVFAANFDTATGKQLFIGDVVTDGKAFDELLLAAIKEALPSLSVASADGLEPECLFGYEAIWAVLPNQDNKVVSIPYSASDIFDARLTTAPDSWICDVGARSEGYFDLNGDGSQEHIFMSEEYMDEWSTKADIHVGDKVHEIEYNGYDCRLYAVRAYGNYYIWYKMNTDNDWPDLRILDPLAEGDMMVGRYGLDDAWEWKGDVTVTEEFTDPADLRMSSRTDAFSTYNAMNDFFVDDDGLLSITSDIWESSSNFVLTTKVEISCDAVDGSGNVTPGAKIPAGTYLRLYRTNDMIYYIDQEEPAQLFVDVIPVSESVFEVHGDADYGYRILKEGAELPDSPVYRITFTRDPDGWQRMVGGLPEDEVFDGCMYAG